MKKKEVELSLGEVEMTTQHISQPQKRKGGLVTMPFIIANEALARVATTGLLPNMILYLMGNYKLHLATATKILFLSVATSNFTPVVGAFIADSCLGRFLAVGLGSFITLLGMVFLWLTAMIPHARPPPCSHATEICKSATTGQMAMLLSSLALMSIGNGGLSCSLPFGADQVDRKDNPNNQRVLEMFFSWYYASSAISVIIAFTGIVYVQDHFGWKLGFGVPTALMFLSTFFFFLASPLYVKHKAHGSLLIGFAQVTVVAYKNRKLPLPLKNSVGMYHHEKDSDLVVPTDKLRFLNKACVIRDPEKDIASDGSISNPWSLCTIEQVEELKAIIKVIPLWSTGIMMSVNIGGSFGLLQAKSMNRHITSHFEVPAGSFIVIMIITIFIWIALYDRVILPLASKLRGKPVRISAKTRMGIGLLFSFLHLVTAAIVENIRRRRAISEGYINNTNAVLNMSAMWLFPQLCLGGIAEAFNAIGQNEFYYTEFPKTMSSIASSLFGLGMAAGNIISSMIFSIVENVASSGGKEGWISDNINKGHFDRYYCLLAKLSAVNILYYLVCSWAYGPTADQVSKIIEENGLNEDELTEFMNKDQFDKVSQETIPVQQMMDGTPQHVHGYSSFPLNSLTESPEPPRSWSQLLFSGLPGKKRIDFSHFQYKKLENWDDHILNPSSTVPATDVIEQEVSQSDNLDGSGHEEFEASGPGSSWSHMEPVSALRSSVTSLSSNKDFTYNQEDHRKNLLGDHTYKVRKEKLDDRMAALHQLVCPFGKADTASVLLETIGYIRFLHSQIEALSDPPFSDNIPKQMRNQLSVHGEVYPEDPSQDAKEKAKDLRSRGLALVPVSCIQHVRDVKKDQIARH